MKCRRVVTFLDQAYELFQESIILLPTPGQNSHSSRGQEFDSQRPAKFYIALQTVRHRFSIYAGKCVALAVWRGDGHPKLGEYNEMKKC